MSNFKHCFRYFVYDVIDSEARRGFVAIIGDDLYKLDDWIGIKESEGWQLSDWKTPDSKTIIVYLTKPIEDDD